MERASVDLRVSEPPPQDLGISEGLRTSLLNTEALEDFAQNMSENIIQSVITQKERVAPEASIYNKDQEMLAEALASAVMEIALSEVSRGQNNMEGAEVEMENGKAEERGLLDTAMHRVKEYHSSTQPYHPPLSQSGLPAVGSLDYPDAPPTTPLVPELERSRSSFARKLKGGLAKVFLPSPPPPTPKEKEDTDGSISDPHVELMEHLMQSLSTDELARDSFEVAPLHEPTIEAFAEALSSDITNLVLAAKKREQISHDSNLHLLAHQLAETIITSSIKETKMLV